MDLEYAPKEMFQGQGYAVVRDFYHTDYIYEYSKELANKSRFGDRQLPTTPVAYRDPLMEDLLIKLLPKVEYVTGLIIQDIFVLENV